MKKFLFICLLLVCGIAMGQIPKPKKKTFVNDYAHLLTTQDIKALNQKLYIIQQQAGVQVAIVLVNKVPKEFTIERFATRIGRKWRVGKNKKGIVYVAAITDHLQRLAIAENLQATFTDEKCEAILADMKPAYRNDDYNGGLTILVNRIHTGLMGPASTPQPLAAKPVVASAPLESEGILRSFFSRLDLFSGAVVLVGGFLFFGGIGRVFVLLFRRMLGGNNQGSYNNYDNGGNRWYRRGDNRYFRRGGYNSGYADPGAPAGDSFAGVPITQDNNPDNWGNWGEGDTGDSGFDDDDSPSRSSGRRSSYSSSSSRSDRSSSSDSSGFSDRGGSSGGGGSTSSW